MNIETVETYNGIQLMITDENTLISRSVVVGRTEDNASVAIGDLLGDIAQVYLDLVKYKGESVTEYFGRLLDKEALSQTEKEELVELIKEL